MHELPLITTVAAAFTAAWVLGLITQRLRLSPIVGYVLAGVLIGPHTPGFTGDIHLAQQLAEIGVILLMFGVGLHIHLEELLRVKWIAIPGAIAQSAVATLLGVLIFHWLGLGWTAGLVLGMAMAVASTVVLIRVLTDNNVLSTPAGHAAVGWLIVEDVFTVIFLVLLPLLALQSGGSAGAGPAAAPAASSVVLALGWALLKLAALVGIILVVGRRLVPFILVRVARLRSRELFTLTVLVLSIAVAAGSYQLFGASMALGAFLAGMAVALSPVSHQAAADALPLRDAFAVLFFVSVGMLFDPRVLIDEPALVLAGLAIVMLAKPITALIVVAALGHSIRTGLTVAVGLAQIGEFSFILSEVARKSDLIPAKGHSVLVATAILSIAINPLLFRLVAPSERWLRARPRFWSLLNGRADRSLRRGNAEAVDRLSNRSESQHQRTAVVVGYGHVGRTVEQILRRAGLRTVVLDLNMDTVAAINREGGLAIFGDAASAAVLEQAGVAEAGYLVVTMAATANPAPVVLQARQLNPDMHILVRTRYLADRQTLEQAGASAVVFEEAEAATALGRAVLNDLGAGHETLSRETARIRASLAPAPSKDPGTTGRSA